MSPGSLAAHLLTALKLLRPADKMAANFREIGATGKYHRMLEVVAQQLKHSPGTRFAIRCQSP